eukprot:Gb_03763 [translate_table: standard]
MDAMPSGGGGSQGDVSNNSNKSIQNSLEALHSFPIRPSSKSASLSQSSSSFSGTKAGFEIDSALYNGGQSLASILNNPHVGKSGVYSSDASWGAWWSSNSVNSAEPAPIVVSKTLPEITKADFQPYLDSIFESYSRFEDVRHHSSREQSNPATISPVKDNIEGEIKGQGEALVACLREIPSLYFKEDFALEDGPTFQAACPFSSIPQNVMLQEKLSHYLDIVEVHLVKEISVRSDSFFEAQGQLVDLNGKIVEACNQLRELKATVKLLDVDLVDSARRIQELNGSRTNLLALHQKLKLISYVNQALSALKLLVAATDCAGALDVIDDLQHFLEGDELVGLHCFRHLGDQLATSLDAVNSILAADFVRAAIDDAKDLESAILSKFQAKEKDNVIAIKEEESFEIKLDDEECSGFRDRLLPLVIGLLRTAKLPAVLRVYRDTLIADIKAAIKTTVAELLPVLFTRPLDGDLPTVDRQADLDGGGFSLASKLRSLSADSFVRLLAAIFRVVQAHLVRAAEVKKVIEWIMGGLDGYYAADAVAAAFASGAVAAAAAEAAQESDVLLGSRFFVSTQQSISHGNLLLGRANEAASPSNVSKNFRADVLRENTEAVCAACDAAHGRWAKLLGVRALLHPKLRLQDFLNVYNTTQDFIAATEKVGGRLGYSIRGTLQSQSKAFIDFQHTSRMAKITAVLDQETWVAIDVPDEFQSIVDSLTFSEVEIVTGKQIALQPGNIENSNNFMHESVNGGSLVADAKVTRTERTTMQGVVNSLETSSSGDVSRNKEVLSQSITSEGNMVKDVVPSADDITLEIGGRTRKGREKSTMKTLNFRGVGYHMVNCGLILLKMISEYMDINNALPALASEVVHRVSDILKLFNTRTCQLVLGAGAMQVSGLKSITAKHLALASQTISFFYAIIQDTRRLLLLHIPEARKSLLLSEIDRVAQDYRVHRDEIHSKLVQIMKERLLFHLRLLPQIAESWNKPEDNDSQPSQFARALTKEVGVLQRVLSPILLESDVQTIFRLVVQNFHSQISDAFSKIDASTPQAKNRLYRDIQHILACIRALPTDYLSKDGTPNPGELDEFLLQRFEKQANQ